MLKIFLTYKKEGIPLFLGSIIFVVGKSPMDMMEPILCRKKSHKIYNEKRRNHH